MKRISVSIAPCLALLFFASAARAQHSASLSWTVSSDAAANPALGYNVYRLAGTCPASGTAGFTKLNSSPVTTTTYSDTTIGPGSFCYYVTATLNGAESVPSNTASAVVLPGGRQLCLKFQLQLSSPPKVVAVTPVACSNNL